MGRVSITLAGMAVRLSSGGFTVRYPMSLTDRERYLVA